jgi:GMP synthase-like glutamine amidotransferase
MAGDRPETFATVKVTPAHRVIAAQPRKRVLWGTVGKAIMVRKIGIAVVGGRPNGHFVDSYLLLKNIAHVKYRGKEQADMHIGILVTNTDRSDFAKLRPTDGEKFSTLMKQVRPQWIFTPVEVKDGEFPKHVSEFDGYIIGGSPSSANDQDPWVIELLKFIRAVDAAEVPTIGICFGHQAIAKALGGEVSKGPKGWGYGVAETWFEPLGQNLKLHAAHKEQVTRLPEGAEVLGGNSFCPIGAFAKGRHIFSTQYHPELTEEFMVDLTTEMEKVLGPLISANARTQFKGQTQSVEFAEWMAQFLEQA